MTRGLTLGKFAPFHKGHELLVQRSLATCDETIVLVYDSPDVTRVPLSTRCGWIRKLYPDVQVIEGKAAPSAAGNSPEVMRLQEDYIRSVVTLPITHFFSSEWYGAHVSAALGALDIRVDERRGLEQISGSLIRQNAHKYRTHLSPLVYRDLVRRVVLIGAESTGKSTLTHALAKSLKTVHVEEYGREFWLRNHDEQGKLSTSQLVQLALEHRRMEDAAILDANRILVVDTDARTTRHYSRWYHQHSVEQKLDELATECDTRYHLTVLCGDDCPYKEDGTRAGEARRAVSQAEIRAELETSSSDWIEVRGQLDARIAAVRHALEKRSLLDWH